MNTTTIEKAQSRLGAAGKLDGRTFVRFEGYLHHLVERAWATTEPDPLGDWFPGLSLECHRGGKFEIWCGDSCDGPAQVSRIAPRIPAPTFKVVRELPILPCEYLG